MTQFSGISNKSVFIHGRRQDFLQEKANIEAPQAPRGEGSGEGVSPSPAG